MRAIAEHARTRAAIVRVTGTDTTRTKARQRQMSVSQYILYSLLASPFNSFFAFCNPQPVIWRHSGTKTSFAASGILLSLSPPLVLTNFSLLAPFTSPSPNMSIDAGANSKNPALSLLPETEITVLLEGMNWISAKLLNVQENKVDGKKSRLHLTCRSCRESSLISQRASDSLQVGS